MSIQIVVVDDSEVDRYLVQRVIKSMGIEANVVEYVDGEEFVNVIRDRNRLRAEIGTKTPPILVLLDINMPRMGGFDVLEAINSADTDTQQVLLVTMYSSSSHAQDRDDALKYDFVKDYVVKPLTKDAMQNLIQTHFEAE